MPEVNASPVAPPTNQFQQQKKIYAKKLDDLFHEMAKNGLGFAPTFFVERSLVGNMFVEKVVGTNYTIIPIEKPKSSKKAQKDKKADRKKNK